jgi:tripartite-type tricarboxylate transporter receptor subunit TctC
MLVSRVLVALVPAIALAASGAAAQDYPVKPIRLLTAEAGGGLDFQARILGQGLAASLGKQVIVENRGGGAYAAEIVAKSAPDGYTLLYYGSNVWIAPLLRSDLPWDAARDFAPVTHATRAPNLVAVTPSLPVKSIKDLIALARARPGELNYASGSTGSSPHLAAELFKYLAGVKITRINYRGNAQAYADVIRGEVPVIFPTATSVAPHLQSGKVRALAVTTAQRSVVFPDLPTVAESGLPDYESSSTNGLFVPTGTPAAIVARLNDEIRKVLNRPDSKDKLLKIGVEIVASSPEEFGTTVKSETARMGKMIKAAGLRDE